MSEKEGPKKGMSADEGVTVKMTIGKKKKKAKHKKSSVKGRREQSADLEKVNLA